jgi:hypothetical protein
MPPIATNAHAVQGLASACEQFLFTSSMRFKIALCRGECRPNLDPSRFSGVMMYPKELAMNLRVLCDLQKHGSEISPENENRIVAEAYQDMVSKIQEAGFRIVPEASDDYEYTLIVENHIGRTPEQGHTCSLAARDGRTVMSLEGSSVFRGKLQVPNYFGQLIKAYVSRDPTPLIRLLLSSDSLASTNAPSLIDEFMSKADVSDVDEEKVVGALLAVMPKVTKREDYRPIFSDKALQALPKDLQQAIAWGGNSEDPLFSRSTRAANAGYCLAALIGRGLGPTSLQLVLGKLHNPGWVADSEAVSSFVYTLGFARRESRKGGIWCLGEIGAPSVLESLSEIGETDRDEEIRKAASIALAEIRSKMQTIRQDS